VRFSLILAIAAFVAIHEHRARRLPAIIDRALASRWAPWAVGALWTIVIAITWGTLAPVAVYHDELSYALQAKLFASGRWTAPSPPLSELWAQAHVIVAPVMASKYPPGHALLLAVGELLGSQALVVFALAFLRGALTFALARRLSNGVVALATSVFLLQGDTLHWGASFFSETTTSALLLVCWYALARYHGVHQTRWLALLAAALGWCAITRPVTGLAFALPIGVVVLRDAWRTRRWADVGVAMVIGTAIVALLPLWSARTTGDWRRWPATVYTQDYMPYDYPHFGVVDASRRRALPPDLRVIDSSLRVEEARHTLARVPAMTRERAVAVASATWHVPVIEATLAVVGLVALPAAGWVGAATVLTLFVAYLAHPTWAGWTIYYMETAPVLVFLAVCGLAQLYRRFSAEGRATADWRRIPPTTLPLALASALALAVLVPIQTGGWRRMYVGTSTYRREFREGADRIPEPAVLFVRHAPWHSYHLSLITNGPDWPTERVWIVADGGEARNAELLRRAPGRRGYFYDEPTARIGPYRPMHGTAPAAPDAKMTPPAAASPTGVGNPVSVRP
jgi:hypothetical protein